MRKPIAILLMLAFIAAWIWLAGTIGTVVAGWSGWLQLVFFILAGTLWVVPLRPLLRWMNAAEPPPET